MMETVLERVVHLWAESENIPKASIEVVAELPGGTVNHSFLVQRGGIDYVVRLRRPLNDLIPRTWETEIYATERAAAAGIAPEIVFSSEELTAVVSRYAGNAEVIALSRPQLSRLASQLVRLHRLEVNDRHCLRQNYGRLVHNYFELASAKASPTADLESTFEETLDLTVLFEEKSEYCFTHHDLISDNILWHEEAVHFIDWEYACFGHSGFDLATIVHSFGLSSAHAGFLLEKYTGFGGSGPSDVKELEAMTRFIGLLEKLWLAAVSAG